MSIRDTTSAAAVARTATRRASADLVGIVEAIYRIESEPEAWLREILRAAKPFMDEGLGLCAGIYDASGAKLAVEAFVNLGNPEGSSDRIAATSYEFTPEYVDTAFLGHVCEVGSRVEGWQDLPFVRQGALLEWGIVDRIGINGLSPDCSGTILGIHLPRKRTLSRDERRQYARIASHLGAAHRLRRRLRAGTAPAEAILSERGRIEHAEGPAKQNETLSLLSCAARAIDRARSRARRIENEALSEWPAMVAARWTLVETFEHGGRRYLLARQNEPTGPGVEVLTERERQIISFAVMGHHNKLIAYELGISHSTVRVLLHRAARKLGVGSRAELVALGRVYLAQLRGSAETAST